MLDKGKFIKKFQEEAQERLQILNEGYIKLESEPEDKENLDNLIREAHTLKGSAKMVGLKKGSNLAHKLEDLLLAIRDKGMRPEGEISNIVFQVLDMLLYITEKGSDKDAEIGSIIDFVDELIFKETNKTYFLEEKKNYEDEFVAEKKKGGGRAEKKKVKEKYPEENGTKKSDKKEELTILPHKLETIRVNSYKIDEILNLVGELVIYQNKDIERIPKIKSLRRKINILTDTWKQTRGDLRELKLSKDTQEQINNIDEVIESFIEPEADLFKTITEDTLRVDTLLQDLHEKSIEIRMLPASYLFSAFPRAVRDMAKEFGKEISLKIEGETTKLDKRVLEEINDPLIHILRNSVDHGIEMPEEREKNGKPRKGTINIEASQEGDRITVRISDDGRGIDPEKIRKVALKKGLLTPVEAKSLSDEESLYLIFKPGFTTKPNVTTTSGRGVGMDVVKLHIEEKLRGHVEVTSKKDEGTTFILTLPLTLAVIRALLVKVGNQTFAFPTTSIRETVNIKEKDINRVGLERIVRIRNDNVTLITLGDVLGVKADKGEKNCKKPAVVISMGGKKIAYQVDDLIDEQPIVIKPIGSLLRNVKNIAGATILGSGELVLIVNVSDLYRNSAIYDKRYQFMSEEGNENKGKKPDENKSKVLVVEDSMTTRELELNILKAAGYHAVGARDGIEAYQLLNREKVDLVLTDIQMPRMDGIELIKKLKEDPELKNLPVVIVSTMGSEKDKKLGLEVGADAYFTKKDFKKEDLLNVIGKFAEVTV